MVTYYNRRTWTSSWRQPTARDSLKWVRPSREDWYDSLLIFATQHSVLVRICCGDVALCVSVMLLYCANTSRSSCDLHQIVAQPF